MIRRLTELAIFCVVLATIPGCPCSLSGNTTMSQRSGTLKEPYVEEPLTGWSADKEPFLATSNEVVEALRRGDVAAAHEFMAPEYVEVRKFEGVMASITTVNGNVLDHRPLQWWFAREGEWLTSVKLLVLEEGCGVVRLTFDPSDPQRAVGVWVGTADCSPAAEEVRQLRLAERDAEAPPAR